MTKRDFRPLFCRIDELLAQKKRVIAAIDGNSAAGKTILAARLKETYGCGVIPMDDFFLRPEQRTPQRLSEPGGNIDYERFREEIIEPLKLEKPFAYRPYDCQTGTFSGPVTVTPAPLTVIEGVYSLHPYFGELYGIKIFLRVNQAEQQRRLAERNPALLERFVREWLPVERAYFHHFKIPEKCEFLFDTGPRSPSAG